MKRYLSMLLLLAVMLSAIGLISCDKKKKDKDLNPGTPNETTAESFGDAGTIDDNGKDEPDDGDGQLNVGEDTEGDKWGEFIPYN